jgi:prepilin-type N-terminal cleavage/methylation domain-containing protein
MMRRNNGFTMIETLVTVVIVSTMCAVAVPRVRTGILQESVRGARITVATELSSARGAAGQRSCPSVIHISSGSDSAVWVTTCQGNMIDTVSFTRLSNKYDVTVSSTMDSIVYSPNGLAGTSAWSTVTFERGGIADTLRITPMGRASI